jgi:hypothetical protein
MIALVLLMIFVLIFPLMGLFYLIKEVYGTYKERRSLR